jgi:hypothetical protein
MDPTPACRDKCASSADMLACAGDCLHNPPMSTAGPVSPTLKSAVPRLFQDVMLVKNPFSRRNRVATVVKVAVVAAAIAGGVWMYKHKKATGRFF